MTEHPNQSAAEREITRLIERAGSDHLPTFGGEFEGGYYIQQAPRELAGLLVCLKRFKIRSYLQIGIAAGGAERLICECLKIGDLTIIDDGRHPKFRVWNNQNRPALEKQGVCVTQHIGNSHAPEAHTFLTQCEKAFDLVGLDGDHTPEGVRMDWELIRPFVVPETAVWLHDISTKLLPPAEHGCSELWNALRGRHKVLYETYQRCGIGLLRIGDSVKASDL